MHRVFGESPIITDQGAIGMQPLLQLRIQSPPLVQRVACRGVNFAMAKEKTVESQSFRGPYTPEI